MSERLLDGRVRDALAVALIAALALAAWALSSVLLLSFAGLLIAVALRHAATGLARHTPLSVGPALALVIVALLAVLVGGAAAFGRRIVSEAGQIAEALPDALGRFEDWLGDMPGGSFLLGALPDGPDPGSLNVVGTLGGTFSTLIGAATGILLVVSVAVFLAADPDLYRRGALRLVAPAARGRARAVMDEIGRELWLWMKGQLLDMIAVAVLTGIGLWLVGAPLAVTLGLIAGITNVIPYVGPFIAGVPAVAIAFSAGPMTALYAALVIAAVQQVEGNVLMPLIQKRATALPPALTIAAVVAFGVLFGFVGLLVATPLLLAVMVLVRMLYVEDVLEGREASVDTHLSRPEEGPAP